jgi:serine/threonine protein kinase
MTERIGQQLGNYRLVRHLGKGGFAEVYLGEHIYLKTQAAIKLLQTKVIQDRDTLKIGVRHEVA